MTSILKFKMLQDSLWKILTPNNNGQSDKERRDECNRIINQFLDSEPASYYNRKNYEKDRCGSCEFWTPFIPEGSCSQKVKLNMGKFDYQITLADYGCTTWKEKKENNEKTKN